jgi:SAM-dependent methyltransferase
MADQGSEGLLSPFLRRQRLLAVKPYLKGRVLDVGCGSGALAELLGSDQYVGVEIDQASIDKARINFPNHQFYKELPADDEKFDTVVALAVIEHVSDPSSFLQTLATRLKSDADARIVCTTPHPSVDWIHDLGAAIGLFSRHANEEHEDLLDRSKLELFGRQAGLNLISYRRFLFCVNQIAVFERSN